MLNVIRPAHNLSWHVAFAFGFAGALQEMSLDSATMLASLMNEKHGRIRLRDNRCARKRAEDRRTCKLAVLRESEPFDPRLPSAGVADA
ncbi:MAG: hypothetical protein WD448_04725 [Woeseia sp.]